METRGRKTDLILPKKGKKLTYPKEKASTVRSLASRRGVKIKTYIAEGKIFVTGL